MCSKAGTIKAAMVVDHKTPHKGDAVLFWDTTNWQSLCFEHHNRDKQSQEAREARAPDACGLDGYTTDSEW
jgi:5-methylcytosine-specific restriction endonuclease McrA